MLRYLPLILKNSLRNRRRTILTVGSIALSLCILGLFFAIYRAFYFSEPRPGQELRLITHHKVSLANPLPEFYGDRIRNVKGVRAATIWQWFGGSYKDARDPKNFFSQFGVEPERFLQVRIFQMPEESKRAFIQERTACLATKDIADKHHWQIGERINIKGGAFPVNLELKLVGIIDDPDALQTVFFNHEYLRQALGTNTRANEVGAFWILADRAQDVPRISEEVDKMFQNSTAQTKTESEQAFGLSFLGFLGNVKMFLLSICAAVTFTILLVSGNTISMSVRERVREVGILKTLGYTKGSILFIILGEALFIAAIGGGLGLLLAMGLTAVIRAGPAFNQQLKFLTVTPDVGVIAFAVALLIGLVSAFLPAWGASRTTILDALRTVD
jgi:putative ABC transport system permease protein